MPDGQSLEFSGVTKRFGAITAVSGLTAHVEPGRVTGFLGPNGAGKTTTLRILLGLVRATDGHATIGGRRYADLAHPLQTVGAVLEASSFHPGRTAAAHLKVYAQAAKIPNGRVDEVLGLVGLTDAAGRKVGGFSLGMRQRLGLAYALLGDPGVLVLDEPSNGLDPEGIRWMRGFLRELAREGRTVLVSSHLLAEVQQTADALLIISGGRLVFQGSLDDLSDTSGHATVVDAPDRAALTSALQTAGVPFEVLRSGLTVRGVDPATVGAAAAAAGVALSSLQRRGPALEEVFLDLVNGVRVHPSAAGEGAAEAPADEVVADAPTPTARAGVAAAAVMPTVETDAAARTAGPPEGGAEAEIAADPWSSEPADPPRSPGDGAPATETKRPEPTGDADPEAFRLARSSLAQPPGTGTEPVAPGAVDVDVAEAVVDPAAELTTEADNLDVPAEPDQLAMTDPAREGAGQGEHVAGTTNPDNGSAAFAVASTGIIDIVPTAQPEQDSAESVYSDGGDGSDDPPPDADPDVEALGTIDDELSVPEPADEDDARPWENREKTDADLEADRFFAAFDDTHDRPDEPEAEPEPDGQPEPDREPEPDSQPEAEPDPEPEAEGEPDGEAEAEAEPDREPEPDSQPEAEPESEPEPDGRPEAEPDGEAEAEASVVEGPSDEHAPHEEGDER